ncbi:acyltransferase family protein [Nocardioides marinquilinus]|uniref:Acyltransferase family protein n=1 Tax=Nocardioides marinquilinus TaxID=1210400 RepID=A0ABP9PUE7_9ACTN
MPARDPYLDNAKVVLVTLAVIGHWWSLLPQTLESERVYDFLYTWHMPALVLVTGYLSRHFSWSGPRLRSLAETVVVPYLLFSTLLAAFTVLLGYERPEHMFLVPMWPLWYLMSLFFWRLATPAVTWLPAPLAVAAAVAVSLLGGTLEYPYLDVTRVTGLFPFFVLGVVLTPELLAKVRLPAVRAFGLAALAYTFYVVVDGIDEWAGTQWLYFKGYDYLGVDDGRGIEVRAFLLLVGLCCTVGALALVPATERWWTRMGGATMVVFLVHGFVLRVLGELGFEQWALDHPRLAPVAVVGGSIALAVTLASPPAVRLFTPVVDPIGHLRAKAARPTRVPVSAAPAPPRPARETFDDRVPRPLA